VVGGVADSALQIQKLLRCLYYRRRYVAQAMREFWSQLHDLFDTDDGSLPDIFVANLSNDQVRTIYQWVRSQCDIYCDSGDPTLWDRVQECDVSIKTLDDPAQLVISGRAEPFRHGLAQLSISGIDLPPLTVAVYPNQVEFDYRMGSEWGPSQLAALFDFLWAIQQMAPDATISHVDEGGSSPSPSFTNAWHDFKCIRNDT